jgi:ATP-dependent DNA helicase PIF1
VIWSAGVVDPRKEPPFALLVHFDKYTGPEFHTDKQGRCLVPLFMSKREFFHANNICSRSQFPVTIAYAITVHKAQGITVEQAVLNITDRDFAPGLTYVAVSRVKSLHGLLFEESFDFERFRPTESATSRMRKEDIARRRHEHVFNPYPLVPSWLLTEDFSSQYGCLPVDSSSPAPIPSPPDTSPVRKRSCIRLGRKRFVRFFV